MDCKQFREVLDCYIDRELSASAMSAADAHRRECAACARAADSLEALRQGLRRVVTSCATPPDLERRIRQAIAPPWLPVPASGWRASRWAMAAALVLAVLGWAGVEYRVEVRQGLVVALDQAVVTLADPTTTVVLEATVLCRDCELETRYGVKAPCDRIGHHGVLATTDGHLWNIMEHAESARLIHDNELLGRKVRVRGRLFRDAGSIAIDSYQLL